MCQARRIRTLSEEFLVKVVIPLSHGKSICVEFDGSFLRLIDWRKTAFRSALP